MSEHFWWRDIADELLISPEFVTNVAIDSLTGESIMVEALPYFPTKKSRDDWERKRNRAIEWAEFVRFMGEDGMGEDGMGEDNAMFIAAELIKVGKTPKQGRKIYDSSRKAAVKESAKKRKAEAIPKPESFGSWA